MIFTFKRAIGTETLYGDLAHSVNPRLIPKWLDSMRASNGFLRIDDGEAACQAQVMPARDLLEVRDGDRVIWSVAK